MRSLLLDDAPLFCWSTLPSVCFINHRIMATNEWLQSVAKVLQHGFVRVPLDGCDSFTSQARGDDAANNDLAREAALLTLCESHRHSIPISGPLMVSYGPLHRKLVLVPCTSYSYGRRL